MSRAGLHPPSSRRAIEKAPTGIEGLDDVTGGGLPRGRATLVCGGPGTGKTLVAMEFLVRGAAQFHEPGLFVSFEERPDDIVENTRSLGFDVPRLIAKRMLAFEHVEVAPAEIVETGSYDLEGLFIILDQAIARIGAKRVAIDTIESLFAGLTNHAILRAELRRLLRWFKDRGITVVITGERGEGTLTRHGLEEYVSDCVITLDHHVLDQITTRRLRIVKYRGSAHGSNAYPFLIGLDGLALMPITSMKLDHRARRRRVLTGVPGLDEMLGGKGIYEGTSLLLSGGAGTGKTTFGGAMAAAACARGERAVYFSFEESPSQVVRNLASAGIELARHVEEGRLSMHAMRPTSVGMELHLGSMMRAVREAKPRVVVVDPVSAFAGAGEAMEVRRMVMRLVDHFKAQGITTMFTSLASEDDDRTPGSVSSLFDTWIVLREHESNGERNRLILLRKSRGIRHSNQVREFRITSHGIEVTPVYVGPSGVLTGSARATLEAQERAELVATEREAHRHEAVLMAKKHEVEAQVAALQSAYAAYVADENAATRDARQRQTALTHAYVEIGKGREESGRGHESGRRSRR